MADRYIEIKFCQEDKDKGKGTPDIHATFRDENKDNLPGFDKMDTKDINLFMDMLKKTTATVKRSLRKSNEKSSDGARQKSVRTTKASNRRKKKNK